MANTRTLISSTTAAVANRFVTSTNMKVGAYTIVNSGLSPWGGGFKVTLTHVTVVAGTDTLGTVTIVGTNLAGQSTTEILTPSADATVTSTNVFKVIASATGAGWVIAGGNDTLTIGCAEGCYVMGSGGHLHAVAVNTTAAAAVALADSAGTFANLKASIAEGVYAYDVDVSGYLKVSTTSTNDLTIIHTPTIPTYATT